MPARSALRLDGSDILHHVPVAARERTASTALLQTADRVLEALFYLADAGEASPTGVAEWLNVSKATAFNLLRTLEKHQLANFSRATQRYTLGPAIFRLVYGASSYSELTVSARPRMERLVGTINETVTLHVRIGPERLCIERFESTHWLRRCANVGERFPLHSGATGRVMLAWESPAEVERYLADPLQPVTARTMTDSDLLRTSLASTRTAGYAEGGEDPIPGVSAVSVPVLGNNGLLLAALTISGPSQRWTPQAIAQSLPSLLVAAAEISAEVGGVRNRVATGAVSGVSSGGKPGRRRATLQAAFGSAAAGGSSTDRSLSNGNEKGMAR